MVITSHALLQQNPDPSEAEIRKALAGNLCMCTGYVQIVDAVKEAAKGIKNG
jgi:aerobic-type carbon monoxide dehydrogenase small subunit (CoxS/CutS family)